MKNENFTQDKGKRGLFQDECKKGIFHDKQIFAQDEYKKGISFKIKRDMSPGLP